MLQIQNHTENVYCSNITNLRFEESWEMGIQKLDYGIEAKSVDVVSLFCNQYQSEETQRAYRRDLESFLQFIKESNLHPLDIKPLVISAYCTSLREKKTVNTINRYLGTIKAFYKWLVANEYLTHSPAASVKALKGGPEEPTQAFSDEEAKRMIEAPEVTSTEGNCDRLILSLLFYLGLRRNEVCSIKVKDIFQDRDHWVVKIVGKGNKRRTIPLSQTAFQEIAMYKARYEFAAGASFAQNDYLCQRSKGKSSSPIDASTVYRAVQKYAQQCDILRKVGPHSCRVTAISHLLEKGVSARNVADFAGHSSISTTMQYDAKRDGLNNSAAHQIDFGQKVNGTKEDK